MSALASLLQTAPRGTAATLHALALAESLTDRTAETIYAIVPVEGLSFSDFSSALRFSDIVEPRNSEWNLIPSAKKELAGEAPLPADQVRLVHQALLRQATREDRGRPGIDTPSYLFTDGGLAYHYAAVGEIVTSLRHYSEAAMGRYNGAQWLAAAFAAEQERVGVLPAQAIETTFLRAMVLFRSGRRSAAMPLLQKVADTDQVRREVGVALHLVGDDQARRRDQRAEQSYRRSIEINEEIQSWLTLSHALHGLANLYAREHRYGEAETAYLRSKELRLLDSVKDWAGLAMTETSLGNMYARQNRAAEAKTAFARSIEIDKALENSFGVAITENALANLYTRERDYLNAETAFKRSIAAGVMIGEPKHVALTEHTLANIYADQGKYKEAENLLVKSRSALTKLNDEFGVAVTSLSLANLYAKQGDYDRAEAIYQERVTAGERLPYKDHLARVLLSYGRMIATRSPEQALTLFERSLEIDRQAGNRRGVEIVRNTINDLYRRNPNLRR